MPSDDLKPLDGDDVANAISNDISVLESRLKNLHLTSLDESNGTKSHKSDVSASNHNDIRSALKNIGNFVQQNHSQLSPAPDQLNQALAILRSPLEACGESENEISSVLSYLKLLSEICPALPQPGIVSVDPFWQQILDPISTLVLDFLTNKVFHSCLTTFSSTSANCGIDTNFSVSNPATGFAFHQQLGTLLKGVRIVLVYLKRATANKPISSENQEKGVDLSLEITKALQILCALLNPLGNTFYKQTKNFDVGLDIRCNIGVAICYSLYYLRYSERGLLKTFFREIFSTDTKRESTLFSDVEKEVLSLASSDVNRIALAFAILNTWLDQEHDSDLYFDIARSILSIQHGVKEAVNLGSSRVLEAWTNSLAKPVVPSPLIQNVSTLFPSLEFFCFMYMPGHIDAVKNCCRNIISALAQIYDRLDEEKFPAPNGHETWISRFLLIILEKPVHIRWLALACVCRNTKKSLKILEIDPDTPEKLLTSDRIFKVSANDAYVALMSYHFPMSSQSVWERIWIEPLFATQRSINIETNWPQKRSIISTILNSEKLRLAQIQPMIQPLLDNVLRRMNTADNNDGILKGASQDSSVQDLAEASLLAAETIKVAHELKITVNNLVESKDSFRGLVPRPMLHQWLWSDNSQIRLAGLALLVETKKTTEQVSKEDFESIKIFFKYNLLSQNPAFRQQFVSYFKKFVRRLKDSFGFAKRKKDTKVIEVYEDFLRWLWNFLTEEGLFYGANFGRRCQALDCLSELTQTFTDFQIYGLTHKGNIKYLRWLKDTYENNKNQALEILVRMPMQDFQDPTFCQNLYIEAINLCKTVKPPDSVTGRYLITLLMRKCEDKEKYSCFAILESLYSELVGMYESVKSTSLIQVSSKTPLYGCVRCIRMILQNTNDYKTKENALLYREYVGRLLKLCFTINDILFPVLGNAAPEGFIPGLRDSNPEENKQVVRSLAAQMLLVCAWRTMKEICLLMSDMCTWFIMEGESTTKEHLLTFQQVSEIGDHLLHLLKNLMHRGVFEQVYVGFKQIANRLWKSPSRQLSSLPEKWLQDAMDQEHISAKSITRRSAGLPFIFQALLSAESDNEQFLQKWVQRLLVFDESPDMAPIRIHSMNVLRGLFRDASFSSAMMPFVPHGLRMAFRGLKSADWTERNSGLMLYGAVMRRSFGPKLNLMNAPTFFRKFPQMYDFLLEELATCIDLMEKRKQEKIDLRNKTYNLQQSTELTCDFTFHLLLLLSSFTPSGRVEDTHFKLGNFIPAVMKCGASDDMEVRKLSAKALTPFLTSPEEKRDLASNILKQISKELDQNILSQNHLHGLLCQFLAIADSLPKDDTEECRNANSLLISTFFEFILNPSTLASLKASTVFETVVEILVVFHEMKCLKSPQIFSDALQSIIDNRFEKVFDVTTPKNVIPGLPVADRKVANAILRIFAGVLSEEAFLEKVYSYFTNSSPNTRSFREQFLEICCGLENKWSCKMLQKTFEQSEMSEGTLVVVDAIIENYLNMASTEFTKYPGTEFELAYLRFMENLPVGAMESSESEMIDRLISRLFEVCLGQKEETKELTTLQIKSNAFMILGKLAFSSDVPIPKEMVPELTDLVVEWSASAVDDDLREAVAQCFPKIPFQNLKNFSALNQAKIWASILMLAQDDETYVRRIITKKLIDMEGKPRCDRKSLEVLTKCFFTNFLQHNPIEGLVVLIGLLLREEFEVEAKAADDETDDRLFDKSEMNMYFEHETLAKIVKSELDTFIKETPSFKLNLNTFLSENQIKLFLLVSNRVSLNGISSRDCSLRKLLLDEAKSDECTTSNNGDPINVADVLRELTGNSDSQRVRKVIQNYLLNFARMMDQ